jgi:hypothetical protein
MDNQVAMYPFANQTTAANAIITQPLKLSIEMVVPAVNGISFAIKSSIISAMKKTLDLHTALGGWYNVSTPNYIYTGCLLTSLMDATDQMDGSQVQNRFIWNFIKPLVTSEEAQAAQNQPMSAITNATQNTSNPGVNIPSLTTSPVSNVVQNIDSNANQTLAAQIATMGAPTVAIPIAPDTTISTLQF